jgi:hypothetical protein
MELMSVDDHVPVTDVTDAAFEQRQISVFVFWPEKKAEMSRAQPVFPAESVTLETDWVAPVRRWQIATSVLPATVALRPAALPTVIEATAVFDPAVATWTWVPAIRLQRCGS